MNPKAMKLLQQAEDALAAYEVADEEGRAAMDAHARRWAQATQGLTESEIEATTWCAFWSFMKENAMRPMRGWETEQ